VAKKADMEELAESLHLQHIFPKVKLGIKIPQDITFLYLLFIFSGKSYAAGLPGQPLAVENGGCTFENGQCKGGERNPVLGLSSWLSGFAT
jgi:hypothetical protein